MTRSDGQRKRKAVRGCIVGPDLAVLNLVIIKKGAAQLPGITDTVVPRRLGPKRASHIRKLFNLTKKDDVRQYVIRRTIISKKDPTKKFSKVLFLSFFLLFLAFVLSCLSTCSIRGVFIGLAL